MSLRRRLLVVVVLAAVALGAAVLAIGDVLTSTDAARIDAMRARLDGSIASLVAIPSSADPAAREERSRAIAPSIVDGVSGYCTPDGEVVTQVGTGRRGELEPRPKPLPPDQRERLAEACRASRPSETRFVTVLHPHDTVVIATRSTSRELVAFALGRVPTPPVAGENKWKVDLGMVSIATLLLVVVTVSAVVSLGGGIRELETSLRALQTDLRASLPRPRTAEFARLTQGLGAMAVNLADAHDNESRLTRDLAHRQRLSGLGRVVAGVAHEIRNPLAGVKLKLDVLERRPEISSAVKEDVRGCLVEVARLDRVVQSLLVVARKPKRFVDPVDLVDLVAERAALLASFAASRSVAISIDGAASAKGDRDELGRAVDNLLRNAIEASAEGGSVEVHAAAAERSASIRFVDHGAGIPKEREAELFEPFSTDKPEGTGLGLWLSRALVEAHGGTLTYERAPDATTFVLRIPDEEGET